MPDQIAHESTLNPLETSKSSLTSLLARVYDE